MKYSRRRHSVLSLMLKRTLYCPVIQSVPVFASAFHNKIVKQTRHRENAGFTRFRSSWHMFNLHSVFILEPRIIGFLHFDITPVLLRNDRPSLDEFNLKATGLPKYVQYQVFGFVLFLVSADFTHYTTILPRVYKRILYCNNYLVSTGDHVQWHIFLRLRVQRSTYTYLNVSKRQN